MTMEDDLEFNLGDRPTELSFDRVSDTMVAGVVFPFTVPVLNSAKDGYYQVTVFNLMGDGQCDSKCRGFTYYQRCRHLKLVRECLDKWIKQIQAEAVP